MYAHMHKQTHTHAYAHTTTYADTHVLTHAQTQTHACIHLGICIHVRTHAAPSGHGRQGMSQGAQAAGVPPTPSASLKGPFVTGGL